ncbi:MAG: DUF2059 domain-containing protein [Steroidobacteraceae bacterium]|jgi:hypothetical protein
MMKAFMICALALLVSGHARAQDVPQPASSASIKELLDLLNTRQMLDQVAVQTESLMRSSINDSLKGRQLTPDQQSKVDDLVDRTTKIVRESLNWDSMELLMEDVYQKSLSEEEIQGMITFYRSPPGQAVIAKMPLILRNTMLAVQERQKVLMAKLQQMIQETVAQLPAKSTAAGS